MMLIPIIYYWYGPLIAKFIELPINLILWIICVFVLVVEVIRIWQGWLFFAQRDYERKLPSSFSWSTLGITLVLTFSPYQGYQGAALGLPIIWTMCLGDPLLGELRIEKYSKHYAILVTLLTLTFLWLCASYFLNTPWYYALIMPTVAIVAEILPIPYVDDNFIMLALPLLIAFIINSSILF